MYKCKNFNIKELVSEEVYNLRGEKAWELFQENALRTLDEIRAFIGLPIVVNDWAIGGGFHNRGFRTVGFYKNISFSQHLLGNAFDFYVIKNNSIAPANSIREQIIKIKEKGGLQYLTGLELDVSWVHIDCRQSGRLNNNGLFTFRA